MFNEITIKVAGKSVTYIEQGTGPDILLLFHGGGIDRADLSWRHAIPAFADRYRVIAPVWPGYGGSESLRRPHTVADLGHWLVRLLDAGHWPNRELPGTFNTEVRAFLAGDQGSASPAVSTPSRLRPT